MAKRKTKPRTTTTRSNYSKSRSNSRQAKSASPVKWLLLGIVLGGIAAAGIYFYQNHADFRHSIDQLLPQAKHQTHHKTKQVVKSKNPPAPQFSFYTMLKNQKTVIHKQKSQPTQSQSTPPITVASPQHQQLAHTETPKKTGSYYLQVASFHKQQDADHVKAKLTLMGFNVNVAKFQAHNSTWYRVVIGPYQSKTLAQSDQKRLAGNKIKSFLRHLDA